jgi:hypothetical protein
MLVQSKWRMNGRLTHSKWDVNGRPTHCAFEPCGEKFEGSCFHAGDGRYYCNEECAVEAANSGFRRIDNLAPRLS